MIIWQKRRQRQTQEKIGKIAAWPLKEDPTLADSVDSDGLDPFQCAVSAAASVRCIDSFSKCRYDTVSREEGKSNVNESVKQPRQLKRFRFDLRREVELRAGPLLVTLPPWSEEYGCRRGGGDASRGVQR
eukprot:scaffold7871_cov146-Skeletonema_marinoi.AAC.3